MKGRITHEESQAVTMAFRKRGHHFMSNDLKLCSGGYPEYHTQGDCFEVVEREIESLDFLGMHPDCTYLTNAGIRWLSSKKPRPGYVWNEKYQRFINPERWVKMVNAAHHFKKCYETVVRVGRGYIENPKMHPYAMEIIGIPSTQSVHPFYFGTPQMKETHLWIVGLPKLEPTNMLVKPKKEENYEEWIAWQDCWTASPGPDRAEKRSKTDPNIAEAFADQWGGWIGCDCQKPWGNPSHISNYCTIHNSIPTRL